MNRSYLQSLLNSYHGLCEIELVKDSRSMLIIHPTINHHELTPNQVGQLIDDLYLESQRLNSPTTSTLVIVMESERNCGQGSITGDGVCHIRLALEGV